ncbi:MAG: DinB family protein [Bacteroidota bacterium]
MPSDTHHASFSPDPAVILRQPLLQRLAGEAAHTAASVATLSEHYTRAQRRWQPAPKAWSMNGCIEHLVLTDGAYLPRMEEAVRQAPSVAAPSPFQPSWFGRLFQSMLQPTVRFRLRAPASIRPTATLQASPLVLDQFKAQQDRMLKVLYAADAVDLNRVHLVSPLSTR